MAFRLVVERYRFEWILLQSREENCADVSYFIVLLGGRNVRTYRILSSYWLVPKIVLLMYVVTITDGYRHERSQYRLSDTLNSAC